MMNPPNTQPNLSPQLIIAKPIFSKEPFPKKKPAVPFFLKWLPFCPISPYLSKNQTDPFESKGCKVSFPSIKSASAQFLALLMLAGCQSGDGPVAPPDIACVDASVLKLPRFSITKHGHPVRMHGKLAAPAGVTWAKGDSVAAFFGGKPAKLVFVLNHDMYLVAYDAAGQPTITLISHNDEGSDSSTGSINSPLFSPDGNRIVFAGTTLGKPAFIQDVPAGEAEGWRIVVDQNTPRRAHVTADPHWHSEGGKTWIYFGTLSGLVRYDDKCDYLDGATYRTEVTGDTTTGPIEVTGIPGAYRGGISKDGKWVGTSYATSALFDMETKKTTVLAGGAQQCNPSMNPYAPGSLHMDYMMILAFGGKYPTVTGDSVTEGLHQNLWIYNNKNQIVWRANRPDTTKYLRWDKPEWSTHPNFATGVCLPYNDERNGDLIVVKVGDLSNASEDSVRAPQAYLKIGQGNFNSDSYSHLWVEQ
jgi:hypothetical protein